MTKRQGWVLVTLVLTLVLVGGTYAFQSLGPFLVGVALAYFVYSYVRLKQVPTKFDRTGGDQMPRGSRALPERQEIVGVQSGRLALPTGCASGIAGKISVS
jgi:hypothetical protein